MKLLKYKNKYYNTNHILCFYLDERGIRISFNDGNVITITTARRKYLEKLYNVFKNEITSTIICDIDEILKKITDI